MVLFDNFNNVFLYLYGVVKNIFYLNPTARSYSMNILPHTQLCIGRSTKANQDVKSDRYTFSASALSSCLHSPDTLDNAKLLLARLNEPHYGYAILAHS